MKTLKLISIVLILSLASCRSREMSLSRSKTSETEIEKISLNESHSETVKGVRVLEVRDSSKQFVGMRIYPVDTFSLNVKEGFRGTARVVEYWGVEERVMEGKESSVMVDEKEFTSRYVGDKGSRKDKVLKSREVRKKSLGVTTWFLIFGMAAVAYWIWSRERNNR